MKKIANCFISYCHEDIDRESLEHLVSRFEEESSGKIKFHTDYSLSAGDDLPKYMELLEYVDGTIMIFTPAYKNKIQDRKGGVYKEFSIIMNRYYELEREANIQTDKPQDKDDIFKSKVKSIKSPFCLIPIVFSSTHENSVPKELYDKLSLDFTSYRALSKGGKIVESEENRKKHIKLIRNIISEIFTYNSLESDDTKKQFHNIMNNFFEETKFERVKNNPWFYNNFSAAFVKTHAYKKLKRQTSYILIGRKGSGKTTISNHVGVEDKSKYKQHINIDVNEINLEYIYGFLFSDQIYEEFNITINQLEMFEISWMLYIYISCFEVVVHEYKNYNGENIYADDLKILRDFLISIDSSGEVNKEGLFIWCYSAVLEYKEKVLELLSDDPKKFYYEMRRDFSIKNVINNIFTTQVIESFRNILKSCSKKIFISLDGFDTKFEEFRNKTHFYASSPDEKSKRYSMEIDWLRAYIHIVMEIKSGKGMCIPEMNNAIDFCVVVPKERFIEVKRQERDSIVYLGKEHHIMWSGIELSIMLRKRLELLSEYKSLNTDKPHERLNDVLSNAFPHIPDKSIINISGKEFTIDLFVDVLRHTFWRPREILAYFAKIISVLNDYKNRDIKITNFAIDKCISGTTREIVNSEFINEFKNHCTNISEVVGLFRKSTQILSIEKLKNILNSVSLEFVNELEPCTDFKEKISFLYDIGFIGISANEEKVKSQKLLNKDFFSFTEKEEIFDLISMDDFDGCDFIIHPIFCEYLNLNTEKQRLTMDINWEYLYQQESQIVYR
ncbi:P-loop ATPase, Sll1717 family [Vibrio quintilis]|uniref:TIR domain-containing protein n=1 Tax=Vibrio quintilis TaxID=1117707 RepID=A0A1M7YW00_9VIBR|nr:toll/interleukin-1 receptor domain-containing protein [Vibrio quintilis]SHO56880.1 hypothetical protein VQ7734_02649 [Vibrio quintilis]